MTKIQKQHRNFLFKRNGWATKAFLLTTVWVISTNPVVWAQDDKTGNAVLDEIVVTATKSGATNLQKTALSITAISSDQLNNSNAGYIENLTGIVPSAIFETFGPGRVIGYIRGVGSTNTVFGSERNVGFYLDGVFLSRRIGANTSFLRCRENRGASWPSGHTLREKCNKRCCKHCL